MDILFCRAMQLLPSDLTSFCLFVCFSFVLLSFDKVNKQQNRLESENILV